MTKTVHNKVFAMFRALITFLVAAVFATGAFAQGSYLIKPGDTLQVEVLEDPSMNRSVLVLPDGSISFPLVGSISASGQTVDAIGSMIASGLAPNFAATPTVYVSIGTLAPAQTATVVTPQMQDYFIVGEVNTPGRIQAEPGMTILQLIAQAGGPTKFAAVKRIQLRRTDKRTGDVRTYRYNYLGRGGKRSIRGSTVLLSGDVVVVPQRRLFE